MDEILDFWFGQPDEENYGKERSFWFSKKPKFDQEVRVRFLKNYEQAILGHLDHWQESPKSCLALILLLDQFPRNMFRGQPKAFATDSLALAYAQHAITQGFDQELLPLQRWFVYMPFEHSENIEHQHQSIELFQKLCEQENLTEPLDYANRHFKVIERFGRYPHRNEILGR